MMTTIAANVPTVAFPAIRSAMLDRLSQEADRLSDAARAEQHDACAAPQIGRFHSLRRKVLRRPN